MGEIHEVFVLALSLVWFVGATPDCKVRKILGVFEVFLGISEKTKEKKDRDGISWCRRGGCCANMSCPRREGDTVSVMTSWHQMQVYAL